MTAYVRLQARRVFQGIPEPLIKPEDDKYLLYGQTLLDKLSSF